MFVHFWKSLNFHFTKIKLTQLTQQKNDILIVKYTFQSSVTCHTDLSENGRQFEKLKPYPLLFLTFCIYAFWSKLNYKGAHCICVYPENWVHDVSIITFSELLRWTVGFTCVKAVNFYLKLRSHHFIKYKNSNS